MTLPLVGVFPLIVKLVNVLVPVDAPRQPRQIVGLEPVLPEIELLVTIRLAALSTSSAEPPFGGTPAVVLLVLITELSMWIVPRLLAAIPAPTFVPALSFKTLLLKFRTEVAVWKLPTML